MQNGRREMVYSYTREIERRDLIGNQARRVLEAIAEERARLHLDMPRGLDIETVWHTLVADWYTPFPAWPGTAADDEENGRKWKALDKVYRALLAEEAALYQLWKRYERRAYED